MPIPVAERPKAWVCSCSLAGIAGSNHAGAWTSLSLSYDCCVLSGTGLCVGLITSPEESYPVWSEFDCEASIMRRPWPTRGYYIIWPCNSSSYRFLITLIYSKDGSKLQLSTHSTTILLHFNVQKNESYRDCKHGDNFRRCRTIKLQFHTPVQNS
jgi:hypothetical protein